MPNENSRLEVENRIEIFDEISKTYKFRFDGLTEMRQYLIKNRFFEAPASTRWHGAYEGGLFDHSYAVAKELQTLTDKLNLKWRRGSSPMLVGMFHDLCKIDAYEINLDGTYTWNEDQLLKGHGEKSVMLLSQFMTLTEEEMLCIRYHMGAYIKEDQELYGKAIEKYPNVLFTHSADMIAAKIEKV